MWDLIKSLLGAIFDILVAIVGFVWDVVVWLVAGLAEIAIWIFKNIFTLLFNVIADLITNFPVSFLISIMILAAGFYLVDRWQKKNLTLSYGLLQNPRLLFISIVPITFLLIGIVAESGPASIVNNTTNVITVDGDVANGSTVQIAGGGGDGGFLGIPTALWSAVIAALSTVAAAFIALKKKG